MNPRLADFFSGCMMCSDDDYYYLLFGKYSLTRINCKRQWLNEDR